MIALNQKTMIKIAIGAVVLLFLYKVFNSARASGVPRAYNEGYAATPWDDPDEDKEDAIIDDYEDMAGGDDEEYEEGEEEGEDEEEGEMWANETDDEDGYEEGENYEDGSGEDEDYEEMETELADAGDWGDESGEYADEAAGGDYGDEGAGDYGDDAEYADEVEYADEDGQENFTLMEAAVDDSHDAVFTPGAMM